MARRGFHGERLTRRHLLGLLLLVVALVIVARSVEERAVALTGANPLAELQGRGGPAVRHRTTHDLTESREVGVGRAALNRHLQLHLPPT